MSQEELENIRREKKRKTLEKVLPIVLILLFFAVLAGYNIAINWFIPDNVPSVTLVSPVDGSTTADTTPFFDWTSTGGVGALTHEWYLDTKNTFNTPFLNVKNTGVLTDHTPVIALDDGYYCWRVEVTDGTNVNVSETWYLSINSHPGNHFPSLSNPTLSPVVGDTTTSFTYIVNFTDSDNDAANYVRVYIDNVPFAMAEQDPTDLVTTDGKNYTYSTTLSVGSHSYIFTCSDGSSINSTLLFNGPVVTEGEGQKHHNDTKMNQVVIYPDETTVCIGGQFKGKLTITEEYSSGGYEVYWYIFLLNADDEELNHDEGSKAIYTSIDVSFSIETKGLPAGEYRLFAKTYDRPRERITAIQLGQDQASVFLETCTSPFEQLTNTTNGTRNNLTESLFTFIEYLFPFIGLILMFIGALKRKQWLFILGTAVLLFMLWFVGFVSFKCQIPLLGILFVILGEILLSKYRIIKNREISTLLGIFLIVIGIIIFFELIIICV